MPPNPERSFERARRGSRVRRGRPRAEPQSYCWLNEPGEIFRQRSPEVMQPKL